MEGIEPPCNQLRFLDLIRVSRYTRPKQLALIPQDAFACSYGQCEWSSYGCIPKKIEKDGVRRGTRTRITGLGIPPFVLLTKPDKPLLYQTELHWRKEQDSNLHVLSDDALARRSFDRSGILPGGGRPIRTDGASRLGGFQDRSRMTTWVALLEICAVSPASHVFPSSGPPQRKYGKEGYLERAMGLEPTTACLEGRYSTN